MSLESIRVASSVLAAIEAHAAASAPRECCGLLLGTLGASGEASAEIRHAEPTRNLASSPKRYDIDPADHFRIMRAARATGLQVIGAYHSHPASAPVPSPTDLAEGLPDFLYLIASPGDIRAYYFSGPTCHEVRLVTNG